MEHFIELNSSPQAQPRSSYSSSHKPPLPTKHNHFNVDDTDSETEDNCQHIDGGWIGEWKLYMNTREVVPDKMDVVCWWGVRIHVDYSLLTTHPSLVIGVWGALSHMAFPCMQLSFSYGIVCTKRTRVLDSWNHNHKVQESPQRGHS